MIPAALPQPALGAAAPELLLPAAPAVLVAPASPFEPPVVAEALPPVAAPPTFDPPLDVAVPP
jgi:hypothetical protein